MNTNRNLARVTTKSRARLQTVSNDVLVEEEERDVSRSVPTSETSSNEQDRSQVILKQCSMGKDLR